MRLKRYQTFEEAKADIVRFIEDVYKIKRLDSSLGYLPSAEIEVTEVGYFGPCLVTGVDFKLAAALTGACL